jgi:hypothetical protein
MPDIRGWWYAANFNCPVHPTASALRARVDRGCS